MAAISDQSYCTEYGIYGNIAIKCAMSQGLCVDQISLAERMLGHFDLCVQFPSIWLQVDEIVFLTDSGIKLSKKDRYEPLDLTSTVDIYSCGPQIIATTDHGLTPEVSAWFGCEDYPLAVGLSNIYAKVIAGYDYCLQDNGVLSCSGTQWQTTFWTNATISNWYMHTVINPQTKHVDRKGRSVPVSDSEDPVLSLLSQPRPRSGPGLSMPHQTAMFDWNSLSDFQDYVDQFEENSEKVKAELYRHLEYLEDLYDESLADSVEQVTDAVADGTAVFTDTLVDLGQTVNDVLEDAADSYESFEAADTYDEVSDVVADVFNEAARSWTDILSWSAACENGA